MDIFEILGEGLLLIANGSLRAADFLLSIDGDAKDRRISAAERLLEAQRNRRKETERRHKKIRAKRDAE